MTIKEIAINIIQLAFEKKKDKAGKPYIDHLWRTAENAKNHYTYDTTEELEVVALLHDLLEDCPEWTPYHLMAIFNNQVIVDAVLTLTKKDDIPYDDYIKSIKRNSIATAVKLGDIEDNINVLRLPQITDKDIERMKKYHKAYMYLSNTKILI